MTPVGQFGTPSGSPAELLVREPDLDKQYLCLVLIYSHTTTNIVRLNTYTRDYWLQRHAIGSRVDKARPTGLQANAVRAMGGIL